jgi:hypothetical protein
VGGSNKQQAVYNCLYKNKDGFMDGIQSVSHGQGTTAPNVAREAATQEKNVTAEKAALTEERLQDQEESQQNLTLEQEEGQGTVLDALA